MALNERDNIDMSDEQDDLYRDEFGERIAGQDETGDSSLSGLDETDTSSHIADDSAAASDATVTDPAMPTRATGSEMNSTGTNFRESLDQSDHAGDSSLADESETVHQPDQSTANSDSASFTERVRDKFDEMAGHDKA